MGVLDRAADIAVVSAAAVPSGFTRAAKRCGNAAVDTATPGQETHS